MATSKKRINISLPPDTEWALKQLAKIDQVPQATKALQLLQLAIEIEEDALWEKIAKERDTKNAKFLSHEEVWSKFLK